MTWQAEIKKSFKPGQLWLDDKGEPINAHGGGVLYDDGTYYWFGEKRGRQASLGVNVYSSKNLYDWHFEATALVPSTDLNSEITDGCLMERPKVIYNSRTKKYVMWFHLELYGQGYKAAKAAIAISDRVTGPYTFLKSFRPNGNMSRDMTLYVDDDGTAYQIYASSDNYDLRIVRLSDDYLSPTAQDSLLFSKHREAPAIFKHNGKYYLITSGCTWWEPNEATMYQASSLMGPWEQTPENPMKGPEANRTFGGQSTFVLPIAGKNEAFVFMADKWNGDSLRDSRYIWLPISFNDGKPQIIWADEWELR